MTPEQLKISILKEAFSGQLVKDRVYGELPKVKKVEFEENPFDIPEEWIWSCLGHCCEMYTGNSISESVKKAKYAGLKEGYDYIATKDVSFEHIIEYDNGVRIPQSDNFRVAYNGSVLMCIEGGSAGRKIGILDRDVCFGNKLCSFNSKEILNKYIYYYLQSHEFKSFFMDNMSGIIGGVSIKKLKELPIPIPAVEEQKKIISRIEELLPFVDRYAEAYEKLEKFNAKFPEDMKKSILQYAMQGKLVEQIDGDENGRDVVDRIKVENQRYIKEKKVRAEKNEFLIDESEIPFDIPDSWTWEKLGNLFFIIRGSSPRPKGSPLYWSKDPTEHHWITIKDISSFATEGVLRETYEYLTDLGSEKSTYVDKNEIVIAVSGSTTGKYCILGIDGYIYDGLAAIVNPSKTISTEYLNVFFMWMYEKLNSQKVGSAFPNINTDILKNTLIPIPPIEEQMRIVQKVTELLPHCERLIK